MKSLSNRPRLLIVISIFFVLISCNESTDSLSGCGKTVIISAKEYNNAPKDQLVINDLIIEVDCLKINFSSSGCDGSKWVVKLIDSGIIAELYPVQRTLRLSLDNPEACDAYISKEISFDIRKLRVEGNDKVWLNIPGQSILYEY